MYDDTNHITHSLKTQSWPLYMLNPHSTEATAMDESIADYYLFLMD